MLKASYKIATVFGIPIKLHISVIVLLFIYMTRIPFPHGLVFGLGMLLSISLHELGHSLVAIAKKCRVREITLWFIGGIAQMESIPRKPLDEFLMAVAGPAVSLCLGALLFTAGLFLPPMASLGGFNYFTILGFVNGALAVFNLIPAFPMDGGRVLRAALTPRLGRVRATRIASSIGKAAAWGFGIWGLWPPFDPMLIVIAFFIHFAASQEYRIVLMQERGRQFGFWDWVRTASGQPPDTADSDSDEVVISPPPYERGPSSRSRLSEDSGSPFDNLKL